MWGTPVRLSFMHKHKYRAIFYNILYQYFHVTKYEDIKQNLCTVMTSQLQWDSLIWPYRVQVTWGLPEIPADSDYPSAWIQVEEWYCC